MSKFLLALAVSFAALVCLAGCSQPEASSTPAERKAFAGTPPKPGDIEAAMARAKKAPSLAQPNIPQQPK